MEKNEVYRVTGRYMSGSEVDSYHLVSNTGKVLIANKAKAILLISRGLVENMRVQYSGADVIIRGKGVNLNTLPIFDLNKEAFRNNGAMPQVGSTSKTAKQNPLSQYKITKRIMYKTSCIGYMLIDTTGHERKVTKAQAHKLAIEGLILNADASRYVNNNGEINIALRGIGCELKKLPVILVDQNGKTVDTTKNDQKLDVRATRLSKPGVLYNDDAKTKSMFKAGDYMICTVTGDLKIITSEMASKCMRVSSETSVIGDNYANNVSKYSLEFLGSPRSKMNGQIVTRWRIVEIVKVTENA